MKKILVLLVALLGTMFVAAQDMNGAAWIKELFGKELTNAKSEKINPDQLKGKIVGIYFSAHWCPPCRKFTPQLVKFRDEMVKNNKKFEVVFVSFDKDSKKMQGYMDETKMKWLAMPFNSPSKDNVVKKYGVSGIPMLVIVGPDGSTITTSGRADVTRNPQGAFDAWAKKAKGL